MSRPVATAFTRQISRLRTAQNAARYCKTPTTASKPLFSVCYTTPCIPRSFTRVLQLQSSAPIFTTRSMSSSSETTAVSGSSCAEDTVPDCVDKATEKTVEETQDAAKAKEKEPALPPLTPAEFREYNRMAEHMDHFHNHFRRTWTMMYDACEKRKRPAGMSIKQFLDEGLQFISYLTTHHSIEESYVFPMLAKRMPEFQPPGKKKPATKGSAKAAELIQQHREIHKGMDAFEDYVRRCRSGETELEMTALKAQMDSWGNVLWQHLDEEVAALGAENMRKYWSLEDMRRMRM